MENNIIITRYIAAWNWQILAIIFLNFSFLAFMLPRDLKTMSFYIGLFLVFVICEFMALKRKKEVYQDDE